MDLSIVSWNVASWPTSCVQIRGAVEDPAPLKAFIDTFQADVVCLQETKVGLKKLMSEPYVKGGTDNQVGVPQPIAGYESYWGSNTLAKGSGFNGVGTFVRTGAAHRVVYADGCPLRTPDDAEGRCLFTVHCLTDANNKHLWYGVFNVYAPFSPPGDEVRQEKKLGFLTALRSAMERASTGQWLPPGAKSQPTPPLCVVLCGDLNLQFARSDTHWSKYVIPVESILSSPHSNRIPGYTEAFNQILLKYLPSTIGANKDGGGPPIDPTIPALLDAYVTKCGPLLYVRDMVQGSNFSALDVNGSTRAVGAMVDAFQHLSMLADGTTAVDDVPASRNQALAMFALLIGRPSTNPVHCRVLSELVYPYTDASSPRCLHMVDPFRLCYPHCEGGYTCWDQSTNGRGDNVGSRLDYIFVDHRLAGTNTKAFHRLQGSVFEGYTVPSLDVNIGVKRVREEGCTIEQVAESRRNIRLALNGGGSYAQSPVTGGGMRPMLPSDLKVMEQSACPSHTTCLIYTPPQLSDHIAIRTCISISPTAPWGDIDPTTLITQLKAQRVAYQYRTTTVGIASFFAPKAPPKPTPPPSQEVISIDD